MDYFFSVKDPNGYIHSVDNLILTYYVSDIGYKLLDKILLDIQALKDKYAGLDYWEKLNINPCRKYSFYQHAVHLDDGIYLLVGHYKDFDKEKKTVMVFPMIRLEVNPNKHAGKPVFKDLVELLNENCYGCFLDRYDYAIDIPLPPSSVQVFNSKKERGLYKGTRYFGQRNKNGFCRIYDKQKEQKLDTPLTRIEHVISCTKATKEVSFEKIYIKDESLWADGKLGKTDTVILELCLLASGGGLDYEPILDKLDKRKKRFIKSKLDGCGYKLLGFQEDVHEELLTKVKEFFKIKDKETDGITKDTLVEDMPTDENGFVMIPDDIIADLPFD